MSIINSVRQSIYKLSEAMDDNAEQREKRREMVLPALPLTRLEQPLFSPDDEEESFLTQMLLTALKVLYSAFPAMISFMLNMVGTLINIYLVGNFFHAEELAAVGLGAIIGNMLGYFVIESINMGMGAEAIRAHAKANPRVVGLIYQRGLATNFILCILMTPVLYMSDRILLGFGYKPAIVGGATIYVWGLVPSFYLFSFEDTTKNYLQAQSVVFVPVIIQALTALVHFQVGSALIPEFRFIGAAWAKNIADALNCLLLYLYIVFVEPTRDSWIEWTQDAVHNLADYLQIVMSTGITSYLETLAFQLLCIMVAELNSPVDMATQIAISSTLLTIFLAEVGISHSIINVISQSLTDHRLAAARRKAFIGAFISLCLAAVLVVELETYEQAWLHFFTHQEPVIARLQELKGVLYLIIFLDFFQMTLASVLKAVDEHRAILKIYLYCFFLVGMGSGILLCFRLEYSLFGLWLGWAIGEAAAIVWLLKCIFALDWERSYRSIIQQQLA